MHSFLKMLLLSTALTLTGCSDGSQLFSSSASQSGQQKAGSTDGYYKIGNPYQVSGVWYYPKEDFSYKEIGVSSWYGADFHNGITANGELYDMHALTAAHRTLPLPSVVRVTNLQNGRSLVLRVNDRGPFVNNRIIDVSMRAAQLLGFKEKGTTQVQVEVLPEESKALREELLAGLPTGAKEQITASIQAEADSLESGETSGSSIRPAAPRDLSASASYPRLANARPDLSAGTAPFVSDAVPVTAGKEEQYNDWDEDLPKNQAQKAYKAPVTPKVTAQNAPKSVEKKHIPEVKKVSQPASLPVISSEKAAPGYYVQVGAFGSIENAAKMKDKVSAYGDVITTPVSVNGKTLYRVRLGPTNAKAALEIMDKVTAVGVSGARLVEEKAAVSAKNTAEPAAGQRLDDEF